MHVFALILLLASLGATACGDDDGSGACLTGAEGCPCTRGGGCDVGLTCASDRCVDLHDSGLAGCGGSAGSSGEGGSGGIAGSGGASGSGGSAGVSGQGGSGAISGDGGGDEDAGGIGDGGAAVGGGAGEGGASGSGGMSGTGGTSGEGGMSGSGGMSCTLSGDCDVPSDPCLAAVCLNQRCNVAQQPDGHRLPDDVDGDCRAYECDADANVQAIVDSNDVPSEDGNPCTTAVCSTGVPTQMPITMIQPSESQVDGDCKTLVCSQGTLGNVPDTNDRPNDTSTCVRGACNGSTPTTMNAPLGTTCGASLVCDGTGDCVACTINGDACSGNTQCCSGACVNDQCAACPTGYGDCDGNAQNGCEASLTGVAHCRACGNNCNSLANVNSVSCGPSACVILTCDAGWQNSDGMVDNGCEAQVMPGPGGLYADCTGMNAPGTCGVDETCMTGASAFTSNVTLNACSSGGTSCFCADTCSTANDCPAPPPGGNAVRGCVSGRCHINCTVNSICPTGFTCTPYGFPPSAGFRLCIPG